MTANFSARVKLRRTSAVTVSSSDLGFLPSDITLLCHIYVVFSGGILPCACNIASSSFTDLLNCAIIQTTMDLYQIAMIVALIISVVIHEMAHGYAANWLGDPTARLAGRLSPNPLVHMDPMMSVILPALLILSGSPILFGAAKPVPYNPYNLRNQKWGEAMVAFAGPLANLIIAVVFAALVRFSDVLGLSGSFVSLAVGIIVLNIFLAFFNLVPIPPLDGSKILPKFLPHDLAMKYEGFRAYFERNAGFGFALVILVFIVFLADPLYKLTIWLTNILIG